MRVAAWTLAALLTSFATRADEFQPPGRLVPVFDTLLHLDCTGSGAPTVVLEAGLGGNFLDWTLVQPKLAMTQRVCSYDRAGAGFSARTTRQRSIANITEELFQLVRQGDVARPFVLVGHSFGGLIAMDYARRYPADVAGLVLLDAMHPDQFDRFAEAGVEIETDPHLVLGHTPAIAATYGLPPSLHELALSLAMGDSARVFVVREMSLMLQDAHAVGEAGFPRLPARVLVHGNGEWNDVPPAGRMEQVWRSLQADTATRLGAPAPIVIAGSGHQIALDAPDAVVAAVTDLIVALP
jgi:pimeloyl-ACP methyl ester carboxylesterase